MNTIHTRTGSERVSLSDDYRIAFDLHTPAYVLWKREGSEYRDVADASFDTRAWRTAFLVERGLYNPIWDGPAEKGVKALPETAHEAVQHWNASLCRD